jgi:hypothetical protein
MDRRVLAIHLFGDHHLIRGQQRIDPVHDLVVAQGPGRLRQVKGAAVFFHRVKLRLSAPACPIRARGAGHAR